MKTFHAMIRELAHLPAKAYLTLFTVGVGIGVLILALSVSGSFAATVTEKLSKNGVIVSVANAERSDDGRLEPVRPGQLDENVVSVLESDLGGAVVAAPISVPPWRDITVDGAVYQVRRAVGSTERYAEVMDLRLIAGSFFTQRDVTDGVTKVVVSRTAAETLFGSVEEAIGKTLQPPVGIIVQRRQGETEVRRQVSQTFTVTGVFEDPDEVKRKAYGIADLVVPYTATVPSQQNRSMAMRFLLNTLVVKLDGTFASAESRIRSVLTGQYGEDLTLHLWEGSPEGESAMLEEIRSAVATFSLVVNLLGFVLLVSGSIGILSIMAVEVLGKTREIALERALGASRLRIVREYFGRSLVLSGGSAVVGILISLIFSRPISSLLWPIMSGLGVPVESSAVVTPLAVLIGVGSALLAGGVFGTLPIFSSFKAPIAESVREG